MVHKPLAASGAVCNPRALTHGEFSASILCKQNDEAQDEDDDGEDADDDDEFETLDVYDIKHNEKSSAGWIASEDRKVRRHGIAHFAIKVYSFTSGMGIELRSTSAGVCESPGRVQGIHRRQAHRGRGPRLALSTACLHQIRTG